MQTGKPCLWTSRNRRTFVPGVHSKEADRILRLAVNWQSDLDRPAGVSLP
jgi:hypothetical protein